MDLICTTTPGGYERFTCDYVAAVTHTPFFSGTGRDEMSGVVLFDVAAANGNVDMAPPRLVLLAPDRPVGDDVDPGVQQQMSSFGFPRDTFWPRNATAFVVLGIVLTLLSTQLVAPTRRLHLRLRRRGAGSPPTTPEPAIEA
jgi:hypothetical protein